MGWILYHFLHNTASRIFIKIIWSNLHQRWSFLCQHCHPWQHHEWLHEDLVGVCFRQIWIQKVFFSDISVCHGLCSIFIVSPESGGEHHCCQGLLFSLDVCPLLQLSRWYFLLYSLQACAWIALACTVENTFVSLRLNPVLFLGVYVILAAEILNAFGPDHYQANFGLYFTHYIILFLAAVSYQSKIFLRVKIRNIFGSKNVKYFSVCQNWLHWTLHNGWLYCYYWTYCGQPHTNQELHQQHSETDRSYFLYWLKI